MYISREERGHHESPGPGAEEGATHALTIGPYITMDQHVDREALIGAHLDLARKMARERQGRGVALEDLEQEAVVGLCVAVDRYRPTLGPSFATYAAHWIRKYVDAALAAAVVVKLPVRLERAVRKAHRARRALVAAGDRCPSTEAIAAAAGLGVALCGEALRCAPAETPVDRYGILDPMEGDSDARADELWDCVSLCDALERAVLIAAYGLDGREPETVATIARELGQTRRRVAELLASGLATVGREFRARGWTPTSWAAAVAG